MGKDTTNEAKQITNFAAQLIEVVGEALENEHHPNHISVDEDNATEFMHALATVMPNYVYQNITGSQTDNLGFNHIANRLCVQYRGQQNEDSKTVDPDDPHVNHMAAVKNNEEE